MKKNKLSVIFFLLCIISYYIYKKFNNSNLNYLYIGDSRTYYRNSFNYDKYLFSDINYKNIKSGTINNDFKIIKNKNIYLNQLISNSDVIILSANNFEYQNKCKKNKRIIKEYDDIVYRDIDELVTLINKISNAKVYVIGNVCFNNTYEQEYKSSKYVYISYKNVENIEEIIRKTVYN